MMASRWVSVTGSRTYPVTREQYDLLPDKEKLDVIDMGMKLVRLNLEQFPSDFGVVTGGAKGPDTWAENIAGELGLEVVVYPAEWDKYGKGAGRKRNTLIAQHADSCLVFWDGVSRGTQDFLRKAFRLRREIWMIGPSGTPWAVWDDEFWADYRDKEPPRMDIPGI